MEVVFYVIVALLALALYALAIYLLLHVAAGLLPIGVAAAVCVVLYNYLRTIWSELVQGRGWQDSPTGSEPAYRQYYFRKAFYDYGQVVRRSWELNDKAARWMLAKGVWCFSGMKGWFLWPLGLSIFASTALGAVFAGAAYLVFGLVHLLIVAVLAVGAACAGLLLRAVESLRMIWQRIFFVCPNSMCYRKISLPIYVCPKCGAQHKRLVPGSYGIVFRICRCGTRLPTLYILGKSRMPSICPHEGCHRPLPARAGMMRNLHFPLVGGAAAGKTSFLMANMCELQQRAERNELRLTFTEQRFQRMFDKSRASFSRGMLLDKTAEDSPDAFTVNFTDGKGRRRLLYIYDAAGELFQRMDRMRTHEYYEYTHGILFLLDPFSIARVRVDFAGQLRSAGDHVKPSAEKPQDVYDRMITTLEELSRAKGGYRRIPLAVVITKADAFNLARQIETAGSRVHADGENGGGGHRPLDPESRAVRQWLMDYGEGNLVRNVEQNFKKFRYFHCSSLGRLPDGSTAPFNPEGVLDPLTWLLSQYRISVGGGGRTVPAPEEEDETTTPLKSSSVGAVHGKLVLALWLACVTTLLYAATASVLALKPWARFAVPVRPVATPVATPASTLVGRSATTTTDLNLRSGPGASYQKVGLAERSSRVRILQINAGNGWYEVEVTQHGRMKRDSKLADRGWINSKYLMLD
jgi:hypothetical protein